MDATVSAPAYQEGARFDASARRLLLVPRKASLETLPQARRALLSRTDGARPTG